MISVIVPVYNGEQFLERCVNSILNQTYNDLEIILVEDCSTDNSADIIRNFAKKDSRIKTVFREENGGIFNARNDGIAKAQGEFITFVDDDDYLDTDMYEKLMIAQQVNNSDYTSCDFKEIIDGKAKCHKSNLGTGVWNAEKIRNELLYYLVGEQKISCAVWKTLFRKSIIDKYDIKFLPSKVKDDFFFTVEYLLQCNTATYIKEPSYNYVIRSESTIHTYGLANIQDILNSPATLYNMFAKSNAISRQFYCALAYEYVSEILRLISCCTEEKFINYSTDNKQFKQHMYWRNLYHSKMSLSLKVVYFLYKIGALKLLYRCVVYPQRK